MSIDVIIPAYGNLDITSRAFFGVLINGVRGQHITVIDNGSHDGVLDPLKPIVEAHGHTFMRIEENVGSYAAVNRVIEESEADVIAVVCNDITLIPGSLNRMISSLSDDTPVVGATEYIPDIPLVSEVLVPHPQEDPDLEPGVYYSCFVALRAIFAEVGLFDERFIVTYGDTDWEQRYEDAGFTYFQDHNSKVFHGASVTRKRSGIDEDMRVDLKDYEAFIDKWRSLGREDVVRRHPREDRNRKKAFTENFWATAGEK